MGIHFGDELLHQVGAFSPSSYHAEKYRNARKEGGGGGGGEANSDKYSRKRENK